MVLDLAVTVLAASLLAGLAIGLYHRHASWGITPLLFLVLLLALTVPVTAGLAPVGHSLLGPAVQGTAIAAPVLIVVVLLLHTLAGRRNALTSALAPVVAGLLIGVAALVGPGSWRASLGTDVAALVMAGAAVTLGALAAVGLLELLGRVSGLRVGLRAIPAGVVGVALYGLAVSGAGRVGIDAGYAAWPSTVLVPLAAAVIPAVLVALYVDHRTAGLGRYAWAALADQPAFGASLPLDQAFDRQDRYRQGLEAGQATAREHLRLLDNQPVAAFICDAGGTITYANPALARLLDRQGEALVGRNVTDLLGDKDTRGRPRFATELTQPGRHRVTLTTPKGRARRVQVQIELGVDGHRLGHVVDLGPLAGSNGHGSQPEPPVSFSEGGGEPGRIP